MECCGSWFILFPLIIFLVATEKLAYRGKLPPGPTPLPILGNLFLVGDMPHRSTARLAKTYGPVMTLTLGQVTTVVISSPGAAREVLQLQGQFLSARHVPDVIRALGHSKMSMVWLPPCQQWKHLRTIFRAHLVTAQRLDAYQGVRCRRVHELVKQLRGRFGQTVDIGQAAACTLLNEISSILFSVDLVEFNSDSAKEFKTALAELMEGLAKPNLSDYFPMLRRIDLQGRRRNFAVILSKLYKIFDELIDTRLQGISEGGKHPDSGHDFLDALLQMHMHEGFKLDRHTIRSLLVVVPGTLPLSVLFVLVNVIAIVLTRHEYCNARRMFLLPGRTQARLWSNGQWPNCSVTQV